MSAPLDRDVLKSLKRADLQKICKDYGIKANLKTEALIDLLIDTTQARPRPTPPVAQRAPSGRRVSRTVVASGSRPRGTSTSSVIIHDTDEEDNTPEETHRQSVASTLSSEPEAPPPPPRTRRAKETQYRLGVGRPTLAGGSGARTLTRSSSMAIKKRAKISRSVKPTEAVIQEEEEPEFMAPEMPEAGPSGTTHDYELPSPAVPEPQPDTVVPPQLESASEIPDAFKSYVAQLVAPFQAQVGLLQSELQQRSSQEADIRTLTLQLQSMQMEVQSLRSQANMASHLQNEVAQMKQLVFDLLQSPMVDAHKPSEKSLGKARASDEDKSQATAIDNNSSRNTAIPSNNIAVPAGDIAIPSGDSANPTPTLAIPQGSLPSLLGKRQRDPEDSNITEVSDGEQEGHQVGERRAARPSKKRLKLAEGGPTSSAGTQPSVESSETNGAAQAVTQPPPTRFTVFSGPEEPPETYIDPPPPTTHLSDLFPMTSTPLNGGGAIPRPAGSDENAPHLSFNFSFNSSIFQPMTSTPYDMANPAFVYPEPPGSPSPSAPSGGFVERAGGRIERNDLYHPHGRRQAQSQDADAQSQSGPQSEASRPASRAAPSSGASSQSRLGVTSAGASGHRTVSPNSLLVALASMQSGPQEPNADGTTYGAQTRRIPSSSEIGMSFGMSSTVPLPPDTPGATLKRTMYGTELEGDTRFGDFGVEGVATGFWAGLAPRF
ncbi:hypothetical protein C2E23DRAFT_880598 [Lenzites betulinus]|nr:hypothetical protein C2E23DRAFT_880598 [Lenzites betulinus]